MLLTIVLTGSVPTIVNQIKLPLSPCSVPLGPLLFILYIEDADDLLSGQW